MFAIFKSKTQLIAENTRLRYEATYALLEADYAIVAREGAELALEWAEIDLAQLRGRWTNAFRRNRVNGKFAKSE